MRTMQILLHYLEQEPAAWLPCNELQKQTPAIRCGESQHRAILPVI